MRPDGRNARALTPLPGGQAVYPWQSRWPTGEAGRRMQVATLRAGSPQGGASLTFDDATGTFAFEGSGEVTPAKVLDLENRRQFVWVDPATRERILRVAATNVRMETSARVKARALAAEAAANAAAAQPSAAAGIPAKSTTFEVPSEHTREGGRVVWSQSSADEAASAPRPGPSPEVGARDGEALPDSKGDATSGEGNRLPTEAGRPWRWGAVTVACLAVVALGLAFPHADYRASARSIVYQAADAVH